MEFSLEHLQPKERASFALRSLYETAGCRKYHMGRFEEYSLYQENRSFLSSEQVITFTDLDGRLLALKMCIRDPVHRQDGAARTGRDAAVLLPRKRLPSLRRKPHL